MEPEPEGKAYLRANKGRSLEDTASTNPLKSRDFDKRKTVSVL